MKLQTGGTYSLSRTQAKILTYGSINYIILILISGKSRKYELDKDDMKAHVFYVLPEEYKPIRLYCNVNISKVEYKENQERNQLVL